MTQNSDKKKLVALVSGGGSNLAAITERIDGGDINGEVVAVISSNAEAFALTRARERGIPAYVCARKDYENNEARDREILRIVREHNADYILLAGYLGIISPFLIDAYPYKIVNIHPALLPKFGGKGFFGIHVHEAVIAAGEKESGATVHFVDSGTDTGLIIAQRSLKVLEEDTPHSLQQRILSNIEHKLFPEVVRALCNNEIKVENGKVIFKDGNFK
ncbi:phosphoribosylglycinamide formyltransferase [Pumilibacter muris]|uniref:phosphoribosylglycinamide formyltransferase n=1 Tax=Pumilibacter muris TaxID=2941510 RepID=UPI00203BED9F|nr:phosphoribosylglycinamide formyltransferase [Pumilibacter muris]